MLGSAAFMPQKPRWKPLDEQTPFGRVLLEYMWSQRPPLSVSDVAARTRIPRQTIWQWVQKGASPQPARIVQLAQGLGLPIEMIREFFSAAGYPLPTRMDLDDESAPFAAAEVIRHLMDLYSRDSSISDEMREQVLLALSDAKVRFGDRIFHVRTGYGPEGAMYGAVTEMSEGTEAAESL